MHRLLIAATALCLLAIDSEGQQHPVFARWKRDLVGSPAAFAPIFAIKAPAGDQGDRWLVAAQTEIVGRHHLTRVELVTGIGETVVAFSDPQAAPHARSYAGGVLFRMTPTILGVALASPASREECGAVDLFAAGDKGAPRLLFSFPQGSPTRQAFAESMFYFTDLDGDATQDVVVNRRWHFRRRDSGYDCKNEKLAYRVSSGGTGFESLQLTPEELRDVVARLKHENSAPHIEQRGFSRELTDEPELGEAIFPEEERWRKVRYQETRIPDADLDSSRPANGVPDQKGR